MNQLIQNTRPPRRQCCSIKNGFEGMSAKRTEGDAEETRQCAKNKGVAAQASIALRSFFIAFFSSWRIRSAETPYSAAN